VQALTFENGHLAEMPAKVQGIFTLNIEIKKDLKKFLHFRRNFPILIDKRRKKM